MSRDYDLLKKSGPTIYGSNGDEVFTPENPAKVSDVSLSAKIDELKAEIVALKVDNKTSNTAIETKLTTLNTTMTTVNTTLTSKNNMERYGLSTATKPTTSVVVGTTFYEVDTGNVFMWTGTAWKVM